MFIFNVVTSRRSAFHFLKHSKVPFECVTSILSEQVSDADLYMLNISSSII